MPISWGHNTAVAPMDAADLSPVPESQQTQPAFDLFLIFAAANIVATTLQTGAVLGARYGRTDVVVLVVAGACFGASLVALLAPVGSRTGVPSMIAARAPLGYRGAQVVSGLLYLTNFAWIAVNNTIAASVCAQVLGGSDTARVWSAGLGVLATAVVARGPRAVGYADRIAMPIMVVAGALLTYAAFTLPPRVDLTSSLPPPPVLWGLDVVIGYQVSWLLMFADYSRYTRSARAAATAVFAGLALPALWLMPVGWNLARIAGSDDPGTMLAAAGVGWWTAALVALATITTNFVNIYLSSLAWRTLSPRSTGSRNGVDDRHHRHRARPGVVRMADAVCEPDGVVGIGPGAGRRRVPRALRGDAARRRCRRGLSRRVDAGVQHAGVGAWVLGFIVYKLAAPIGATLPALGTSIVVYLLLHRIHIDVTRVKP